MQMDKRQREYYIDYSRLAMIVLVVILHTAITYSGVGNWHFIDAADIDELSKVISALFITFTGGYSMSFLFLIAAYYSAKSYIGKGKKDFINGRLYRLGLPVALVTFFIYPLTMYLLYKAGEKELLVFTEYIVSGHFLEGSGPLWFALALLIFSVIYAIMGKKQNPEAKKLPNTRITILTIVLVGTAGFLIRLVFPMGTDFLNMPISNFAPHIALFIIGIKAYQYDWFNQVKYHYAKKWLIGTIIIGIISWFALIIFGGVIGHGYDILSGGLSWQSYAYAVWESFLSLGMSIGLLGLFKEKFNRENKLMIILAKNSFSVYVWHILILVGVSLLMRNAAMHPLVKIIVVAGITLAICFFLSHYVFRRLPLLKKIM